MENYNKPDFKKAYILANEMLVKSRVITKFPFATIKLVKEQSDIQCISYKKALDHGVDITD